MKPHVKAYLIVLELCCAGLLSLLSLHVREDGVAWVHAMAGFMLCAALWTSFVPEDR